MKMKFNEFLATVYASLFDFPLVEAESKLWAIGKSKKFVPGDPSSKGARNLRKMRMKTSLKKRELAEKLVKIIAKIPTIEGVFLTGSVAVWNALPGADIDLLIMTTPNTLWITRIMVVGLLKIIGSYRSRSLVADKVCTNIFLDTNHLKIEEKNLYTAHEVLQAECLFDRGAVRKKWLQENSWTELFLPVAYKERFKNRQDSRERFYSSLRKCLGFALVPVELLAFLGQFFYMRPRITREKVFWGVAIFHPNNLTVKIFQKWCAKLTKLKYNKVEATDIFFPNNDSETASFLRSTLSIVWGCSIGFCGSVFDFMFERQSRSMYR